MAPIKKTLEQNRRRWIYFSTLLLHPLFICFGTARYSLSSTQPGAKIQTLRNENTYYYGLSPAALSSRPCPTIHPSLTQILTLIARPAGSTYEGNTRILASGTDDTALGGRKQRVPQKTDESEILQQFCRSVPQFVRF